MIVLLFFISFMMIVCLFIFVLLTIPNPLIKAQIVPIICQSNPKDKHSKIKFSNKSAN